MGGPVFLDPETRRVLLEEIAFQRAERSRFRGMEGEYWQVRADRCAYIIRAIRDVWDRLVAVERRHAENELAADPLDGAWLGRVPAGVSELELRSMWGDR